LLHSVAVKLGAKRPKRPETGVSGQLIFG